MEVCFDDVSVRDAADSDAFPLHFQLQRFKLHLAGHDARHR